MVGVVERIRQGIAENSRRFLKRDAALRPIADRLVFILVKQHGSNQASGLRLAKINFPSRFNQANLFLSVL
jgi:hypothetical protein